MSDLIPTVLDLSRLEGSAPPSGAWRDVARQFDLAMRKHGVVYLANTGVPQALSSSIRSLAHNFFGDSLEHKMRFSFVDRYGAEGYTRMGKENVARTFGANDSFEDTVESFVFLSASSSVCPPALRDAVADYFPHMIRIHATLMQLMDVALGLAPPGLSAAFREPRNALKLSNYPPKGGHEKGLGYGAHTDFTGFTLLSQDARAAFPSQGTLQVLDDGQWRSVPPIQDALLVNAGDFIQRWTNGAYKSPVHRVVLAENRTVPRLSVVFFTSPADEVVVEPLAQFCSETTPAKYDAVLAGEWLDEKLSRNKANVESVQS